MSSARERRSRSAAPVWLAEAAFTAAGLVVLLAGVLTLTTVAATESAFYAGLSGVVTCAAACFFAGQVAAVRGSLGARDGGHDADGDDAP